MAIPKSQGPASTRERSNRRRESRATRNVSAAMSSPAAPARRAPSRSRGAGRAPPAAGGRGRYPRPERVPAGILQLIATWHETPAYVFGRTWTCSPRIRSATALAPYYTPGENLVRVTFLDPRLRDRYEDWDRAAAAIVAALRALSAPKSTIHNRTSSLGELLWSGSQRFRQLWARHDARRKRSATTQIQHPQLGALEPRLREAADPGRRPPEPCASTTSTPGNRSAQALTLLATAAATEQHERETARSATRTSGFEASGTN